MFSLIVPVYLNEGSVPELFERCDYLARRLGKRLEVVFVNDASPDGSFAAIAAKIDEGGYPFDCKLVSHSRNFGSFTAIRTGLRLAQGPYFAMMAADLQEPVELIETFFRSLENDKCDVVIAVREGRDDPFFSALNSRIFWSLYRRLVQADMPEGGIDIFACNAVVRRALLSMNESNTSLVGQLIWIGFRRLQVPYTRLKRRHGRSAWSFRKKAKYLMDSLFSFSDLPIRILLLLGAVGMGIAILAACVTIYARLQNQIEIPGYASLAVFLLLFSSFNCLGLGIVGSYVWRAYENTKLRPEFLLVEKVLEWKA